jgi:dsDNA-binding SOS-regulon protein
MNSYTVRITKEKGKIIAWIDKDGEICIKQPMRPGRGEKEGWQSEEEARLWAQGHAYHLTESAAYNEVIEINKQASEELERQANRATILQAAALSVFAAKQNEEFSDMFLGEARKSLINLNMLGDKHQAALEGIKSNYKEIESWQQILALE